MLRLTPLARNMTQLATPTATILFSYETPVAALVPGLGYLRTDRHYSRTTSKHITQWLHGATAETVPQATIDTLLDETRKDAYA
jgi:hypothetical protein